MNSVGPPPWFEDFFQRHYPELVRAALYTGGAISRQEAEDAVQDVVVAHLTRGHRDIRNPESYFTVAVVRRILDRHRSRRRRPILVLDEASDTPIVPAHSVWEDEQWVRALLELLPPRQQAVFACVYEGLTVEEMSSEATCPMKKRSGHRDGSRRAAGCSR